VSDVARAGAGTARGSAEPGGAGPAGKLGLVDGAKVVLLGAPPGWSPGDLPGGINLTRRRLPLGRVGAADLASAEVTIVFARNADGLAVACRAVATAPPAALWICWPRRAGGHRSDLTDDVVRRAGLALGLVDNKVAALDADWSALRFVRRRERR
jgi:hypothetical protein